MTAIGIIPAAGFGRRILPYRYPKELFPIAYADRDSAEPNIRVVCQYALECLVVASVERAYVIVGDHKFEVMRFLSDGCENRIRLAYLHQRSILGLPSAIDCAYGWVGDANSILVLPDTIVHPADAARQVLQHLESGGADVVLGVFHSDRPKDLCPVEYDSEGRVQALFDKDPNAPVANTWGMAAWTPQFTAYLHDHVRDPREEGPELTLADVFTAGLRDGLDLRALPIKGGRFWDIGTGTSLMEARRACERRDFGR